MLKNRTRAAEMVAEKLIPAEARLDSAIGDLTALTHAMLTARAEAQVSAVIGQAAFDHVGQATSLLFQARSKLIDAHHSLNETKNEIGLRTVSFGAWQDCPPMKERAELDTDQNVVAIGR